MLKLFFHFRKYFCEIKKNANFEFFQIIINKPSLNKRRWFASYGHIKEFDYHYLGFSFEEFEIVEVVIINNKGEEI